MSPPTPPSPPVISRHGREEDEYRTSSRTYHRTTRDYRVSRSRSRGRGRKSRSPDRRARHRTHSRSRSRDVNRFRSNRRYRQERSKSRGRTERPRRTSHRSRSRSYSKSHKSSHKSRSRSGSRSRRRQNRSRSGSKSKHTSTRSRSNRREDRGGNTKQPNVIVLSTETYKDSLKSSSKMPSVQEDPSESSASSSTTTAPLPKQAPSMEPVPSWKTIKSDQVGVYSDLKPDAPIDKEKIHKEIEEKLRLVLAREGKVYPYPKPEPSHPVFANDGSFLEIFKKMQQQQTFVQQQVGESMQIHAVPTAPVAPVAPIAQIQHPPPPPLPVFGRRRGGKILKTGVVAKPSSQNDSESGDVKDFWSIYLREVKKYKSTACESDSKTRPLVR